MENKRDKARQMHLPSKEKKLLSKQQMPTVYAMCMHQKTRNGNQGRKAWHQLCCHANPSHSHKGQSLPSCVGKGVKQLNYCTKFMLLRKLALAFYRKEASPSRVAFWKHTVLGSPSLVVQQKQKSSHVM